MKAQGLLRCDVVIHAGLRESEVHLVVELCGFGHLNRSSPRRGGTYDVCRAQAASTSTRKLEGAVAGLDLQDCDGSLLVQSTRVRLAGGGPDRARKWWAKRGEWKLTGVDLLATAAITPASIVFARGWRAFFRRHRISKLVRSSVPFEFPRYKYRSWLNKLSPRQLSFPVEQVGAELAISLDELLDLDDNWRRDAERSSKSVELVKATYSAMLVYAEASTADALRDGWALARQERVIASLAAQSTVPLLLSAADLAVLRKGESRARRAQRLSAFGVEPSQLQETFSVLRQEAAQIFDDPLNVLIGPAGSGKSELAEEWLDLATDRLMEFDSSPIPVWLHASELTATALQDVLLRRLGQSQLSQRGVALVVDGLDEVDTLTGHRAIDQASVLVQADSRSSAVLTSRPGVLPQGASHVAWDGLDGKAALQIVESISGSERTTWGWNDHLVETIRRPFFAIAAGVSILEGARPSGQAQLIDLLARRALERASSASTVVQSRELFDLMASLAVSLVQSEGTEDGLSFADQQRALTSGLVQRTSTGTLQYSLPLFLQWFAASKLLDDQSLVDEAVSTGSLFDRWRWVLAIAGIVASPSQLDELLSRVIRANPGAGSWVLARISDGRRAFRAAGQGNVDPVAAPQRLVVAFRTWIDAIGDLATLVYPATKGSTFTLGVRTSGNAVDIGWHLVASSRDTAVALPAEVHPLARRIPPGWWPDRSGSIAEGEQWPWNLSQSRFKSSFLKILESHPRFGPPGGVWNTEYRYQTARRLSGSTSAFFPNISRDQLIVQAKALLDGVPRPQPANFLVAGAELSGAEILDLLAWLEGIDGPDVVRPAPRPDVDVSDMTSGWIWDLYTPAGLQDFYRHVLDQACVAYDEAVSTVVKSFEWSLGLEKGEFGVIGHIHYQESGFAGGQTPIVTKALVPTSLLDEARKIHHTKSASNGVRSLVTLSTQADPLEEWIEEFVYAKDSDLRNARALRPFSRLGNFSSGIADDSSHTRPASSIAARWLFNDFRAFDMAEGTFPQLAM